MAERSTGEKRSATTLTCANCHYDLTGLSHNICPECGTAFDPAAPPRRKRPSWLLAIIATLIVMYAPFGWLFFVQDDSSYVRYWMALYPTLPGLAPTFLIFAPFNIAPGNLPEWLAFTIMGAIALGAGALIVWLARCGWTSFFIITAIALVLSIINSRLALIIFSA